MSLLRNRVVGVAVLATILLGLLGGIRLMAQRGGGGGIGQSVSALQAVDSTGQVVGILSGGDLIDQGSQRGVVVARLIGTTLVGLLVDRGGVIPAGGAYWFTSSDCTGQRLVSAQDVLRMSFGITTYDGITNNPPAHTVFYASNPIQYQNAQSVQPVNIDGSLMPCQANSSGLWLGPAATFSVAPFLPPFEVR